MSSHMALRGLACLHRQLPSMKAGPSCLLLDHRVSMIQNARHALYSRQVRDFTDAAALSGGVVAAEEHSSSLQASADHQDTNLDEQRKALALLRAQPLHYVVASIVGRTLLLHERDLLSLPRIRDVQVGDVLELDRIHEVGSRDYTLRAQESMNTRSYHSVALLRRTAPSTGDSDTGMSPGDNVVLPESHSWAARLRPGGLAHKGATLSKDVVRVRCTVVEHTKGPMEMIIKKKRRKGYRRTIRHKQTYTRLRVEALQIGDGSVMLP